MTLIQKRVQRTGLYADGRFENIEKKKEFIQAASRIRSAIYRNAEEEETTIEQARMWINALRKLCELHNVTIPVQFSRYMAPKQIMTAANRINLILSELETEIRINEAIINDVGYIELDENWKSRAGSYISHIRDLVSKAEVPEAIRERILKRLNQ